MPIEFRRIPSLPPYVFATIDQLKLELRRAGEDVIDLGFGNPDVPSPEPAVEKLCEAAQKAKNHRYSASRGIPRLRQAICELYERKWGVRLDPETQAITTIGAKEGLAHLMWALVQPGDTAIVPTPSYPIHLYAPIFAGAEVAQVPLGDGEDFVGNVIETYERACPKPRVVVLSFPHNPTTACIDLAPMQRLVDFAREREVFLVHDFAYADVCFDDYQAPSILQAEGAEEVALELYSMTKGFSMAGWRVGFLVGDAAAVQALARLKSYLDYGTFQPIQIAAIIALTEALDYPEAVADIYRSRRDTLCSALSRIGWEITKPRATMFVWAPIPEPYRELGSVEFAVKLTREAKVAVSPGAGFGPGGEGYVRFALVENEQRIRQAVRGIQRVLAPGLARAHEPAGTPVP